MAHGNRPAIDIDDIRIKPQLPDDIKSLGSKGFVQLNQTDILDFETCLIQCPGNRVGRADSHDIRRNSGNSKGTKNSHGF